MPPAISLPHGRQLTGVWYACNRSPRISAAKKRELRTILTLKALYLDAPY